MCSVASSVGSVVIEGAATLQNEPEDWHGGLATVRMKLTGIPIFAGCAHRLGHLPITATPKRYLFFCPPHPRRQLPVPHKAQRSAFRPAPACEELEDLGGVKTRSPCAPALAFIMPLASKRIILQKLVVRIEQPHLFPPSFSALLPHLSLDIARRLMHNSAALEDHRRQWNRLRRLSARELCIATRTAKRSAE